MIKATAVSSLLFLSALTAACGGGDAGDTVDDSTPTVDSMPVIDAMPPTPDAPAECPQNPLPSTADNPVTVSGGVYTLTLQGTADPVADADLTVYGNAGASLATGTSNQTGDFALVVTTSGLPVDGYVEVVADGYLNTRVYPPAPIATNQDNVAALVLTPDLFTTLNELLLQETQDPANAWIGVAVLSPAGSGIAGATVSVSPSAGAVHYNADGFPNKDAIVTDADGIAYLVNVPAGPVTITVTGAGVDMRPSSFIADAGLINTTGLVPCSFGAE